MNKKVQKGWRRAHYEMIISFVNFLNSNYTGYVLKGGTALMLCYGLDRFSEDIDLDGYAQGIESIVKAFTKKTGTHYRTAKDTNTVKRFMIQYDNPSRRKDPKPLKIEVSYRTSWDMAKNSICNINGIVTYNLPAMLSLKLNAFSGRDKIRDMYDIVYLGLNYLSKLDSNSILALQNALSHRGLEYFDYLIKTQKDELIDSKKLEENFLLLWDRLGLLK